jgi:hypothetical protein
MAIPTPTSYWKFEGNSNDSIGSVNGTDTSITYSAANGKISQGAGFGGSSRIAYSSALTTATTNFSFAAWVKFTSFSDYRAIVQNGRQANFWWLRCNITTGALVFSEDNVADYTSSATLSTGTWYHVAIVKSGDSSNNLTFYVNGVAAGTASVGTISTPSTASYYGAYTTNGSTFQYPMDGAIDEAGVWNSALSSDDVARLFNTGRGNTYPFTYDLQTGLLSYWKLDGNSNDSVGTANGTDTNISYSAGKIGNAANANGAAPNIVLPYNTSITGFFAISGWIKPADTTNRAFFSTRQPTDYGVDMQLNSSNTILHADIGTGSSWITTNADATIPALSTGIWYHVALVVTKTSWTWYLNGTSVGSGTYGSSVPLLTDSNHTPRLFNVRDTAYWTGSQDEFAIFNVELAINDVAKIYNAGRGNTYPFTDDLITGLISYWKLDESSGNAADSIGSATLTNTNVTYAAGKINNGAVFNGTSSKLVKTAYAIGLGDTYTYAGWFNPDVLDISNRTLFNIRPASGSVNNISMEGMANGYIRAILQNSSGTTIKDYRTTSLPLSAGVWYHIACTWDGTNLKIYVNGAEPTSTKFVDLAGSLTSTNRGIFVGNEAGTGNYWDGMHDELGLWGVALTSTKVSELYNSGAGKTYPFITAVSATASFLLRMI